MPYKTTKDLDVVMIINEYINSNLSYLSYLPPNKLITKKSNHTLRILKKNGMVGVFGNRLIKATTEGLHILVSTKFNKNNGDWEYDDKSFLYVYIPSSHISKLMGSTTSILPNSQYDINISTYLEDYHTKKYTDSKIKTDKINKTDKTEIILDNVSDVNTDSHISYDNLSKREYAAIHLRVPESGLKWLDDLIIQSNHLKITQKK